MRGTRPRFDSHFHTEKIALVVAIDTYMDHGWEKLDTCERDGKEISEILRKGGFEVKTLLGKEATRENIVRRLQNIDRCRTAVVYFAGHGISGKFGPALVPYDASHNSHDIADKVGQDYIQGWCGRSNAHGILLIFDCCFGGDFCVKMRGENDRPSFCINQSEKSRIILSASLMGERVPDCEDPASGSSPFSSALIRSWKDECFSGSTIELFVTTRTVAVTTGSKIVPKLGRMQGDEGGDVFLK